MDTYRFTYRVGDDGLLTIKMPVNLKNAEVEVAVIVQLLQQHTGPIQVAQEDDKFPHSYDDWKPEDDQRLLALLDEGLNIRAVAQQLGRRPRAIEARALRLERQLKNRTEAD